MAASVPTPRQWRPGDGPDVDALEALVAVVDAQKPRNRRLLIQYFGLHGGEPRSLAAIGRAEGITRERVRQLVNRAMAGMSARSKAQGKSQPRLELTLASHLRANVAGPTPQSCAPTLPDYIGEGLGTMGFRQAVRLVEGLGRPASVPEGRWVKIVGEALSGRRAVHRRPTHRPATDALLEHLLSSSLIPARSNARLARPTRPVRPTTGERAGAVWSATAGRSLQFESGLEQTVFRRLDAADTVVFMCEQPEKIRYQIDGEWRHYVPDLLIELDDGRFLLVEAKPGGEWHLWCNLLKWAAALDRCADRGIGFVVTDGRRRRSTHTLPEQPERALLRALGEGPIGWPRYRAVAGPCANDRSALAAFVARNRLRFDLNPFRLSVPAAVPPTVASLMDRLLAPTAGGERAP